MKMPETAIATSTTGRFGCRSFAAALFAAALVSGLAACRQENPAASGAETRAHPPGHGVTIYAAGDIADCSKLAPLHSGAAATAALIEAGLAKDTNAAVLTLGDNTYPVGLLSEFTDCYQPTWGRFKDRTHPAPGNHDYYTPQAGGYYRYFGDAAGPGRRGYYSFSLGSWRLISLNSYLKPEAHQAQLAWLKNELERNKARCTLAYWHHPLFSSGGHGNSERMKDAWQLLHAANAELVLASHDHDYERFAPQDADGRRDDLRGIRQFVVGTGGAKLGPLRVRKPHSEISNNISHGVLRLVLTDTGYSWEFLPTAQGVSGDRGAAVCH